jgi:hypothetical protein
VGAGTAVPGPVHGHPRHHGGERRAAHHRRRPAPRPHRPDLGRDRLHALLRQPDAAGRPAGRQPRPAADIPCRPGPVHGRLAGLGPGPNRDDPGRRPRRPGDRRGAAVTGGAGHHHHHLSRPRAQPGAGDMGGDRGRRRRGRRARRRPAGRVRDLAVGVLHQPPGRHRDRRHRPRRGRRHPGPPRPPDGPTGRADRHPGYRRGNLRAGHRRQQWLGRHHHRAAAGRRAGTGRGVRRRRAHRPRASGPPGATGSPAAAGRPAGHADHLRPAAGRLLPGLPVPATSARLYRPGHRAGVPAGGTGHHRRQPPRRPRRRPPGATAGRSGRVHPGRSGHPAADAPAHRRLDIG